MSPNSGKSQVDDRLTREEAATKIRTGKQQPTHVYILEIILKRGRNEHHFK